MTLSVMTVSTIIFRNLTQKEQYLAEQCFGNRTLLQKKKSAVIT